MVNRHIVVWNVNHKATCRTSRYLHALGPDASRSVVSVHHCNLAETEVLGSSFLHLGDHLRWDAAEELVIGADLRGADDLPILAFASHHEEGGVHGVVELAVGHESQVCVVWSLFLLLLWALAVVDPDVDVNVPVNLVLVHEADLEPSMTEPLQVNFTLERV